MTACIPVTVVVPVKNEERNLAGCLSRLVRFAEVVVVDSRSKDRSVEVAAGFDVKLLQFEWDGHFPKKRNWVLMNHCFKTPWVLFIDADEVVNDRFCDEVAAKTAAGDFSGFWLNYTNYFAGKMLRHGVPQCKLALFRVGSGFYEKIEEQRWSNLDMEVHEHPIIEGKVGKIATPVEHNDHSGIEVFIERHRNYAMWEARRILHLKCQGDLGGKALTARQRFKYRNLERWWYPWFYFLYTYFMKLGLLDGTAGFQYAFYKAWYFLSIRLMIREMRNEQ
jgi:glycosyltransferase involved in cell wall biosynthesis